MSKGDKPNKKVVRKPLKGKSNKLSSEDWYKRAATAMSIRKDSPSIVPGQAETV